MFLNDYCRYGECHPVFYLGPLEDAIKDALQTKARDVSFPEVKKLTIIFIKFYNSCNILEFFVFSEENAGHLPSP